MNKFIIVVTGILVLLAPLASQTITVVSPNGGETLTKGGAPFAIEWTVRNVDQNVKIVLLKENGDRFGLIAEGLEPGGSPYRWTVGETRSGEAPAGNYKVRVVSDDGAVKDESDRVFAIAGAGGGAPEPEPGDAPTITITSPRAGDAYHRGSRQTVTWTSSGLSGRASIFQKRDSASSTLIAGLQEVDVTAGGATWEPELMAPLVGDEVADYHIHVVCGGVHAVSPAFAIDRRELHELTIGDPVLVRTPEGPRFRVTITDSGVSHRGAVGISFWCGGMGLGNAVADYYSVRLERNVPTQVELKPVSPSYWDRKCDVNFVFRVNHNKVLLETNYDDNAVQKRFCLPVHDGRFFSLRVGRNYAAACEQCSVAIRPADVESHDGGTVRVRLEISLQNCGAAAIRGGTLAIRQSWSYGSDRGSRSVEDIEGIEIEPGHYAVLNRTVTLERHLNNTLSFEFDCDEPEGTALAENNRFSCKPNFVGF